MALSANSKVAASKPRTVVVKQVTGVDVEEEYSIPHSGTPAPEEDSVIRPPKFDESQVRGGQFAFAPTKATGNQPVFVNARRDVIEPGTGDVNRINTIIRRAPDEVKQDSDAFTD